MEILLLSKKIRFGCCCCRRWCCSHLAIGNISTPNWKAMFLTFSLSYAFSEKVPSVCAYLSIYRRRLCICIIWKLTVNWRVANWKGTEQKEQKSTDSNDGPVVLIFVAVDVAGVWAGAGTLSTVHPSSGITASDSSSSTRAEGRPAGPFASTQSSSPTAAVANLSRCLSFSHFLSVYSASYLLVTSGPSAATVGRQFIIHRVSIEATLHLSPFSFSSTSLSCFVLNFHSPRTTFIIPSPSTHSFILQQPNCKQIRLCRITF